MSIKIEKNLSSKDAIDVDDLEAASSLLSHEHRKSRKEKKTDDILSDDNVQISVPIELDSEMILQELHSLFFTLGFVSEDNEYAYKRGTDKILRLLDIYDQAWIEKEKNEVKTGNKHSEHGKALAEKIIEYLLRHEGLAETFPYDDVEELKNKYSL